MPIPVSRKESRLLENAGAIYVNLTTEEIADINEKLGQMEIFSMFGGSPVKNRGTYRLKKVLLLTGTGRCEDYE